MARVRPKIVPAVLARSARSWHENLRACELSASVAFSDSGRYARRFIGVRRDHDGAAESSAGHTRTEDATL